MINDISRWRPKDRYAVLIVEVDEANPLVWKPSPLTKFLEVYMLEKAVNTKIHYGYVICDFLNYLTYIETRKTKKKKQGEEELVVNNYSTVKRKYTYSILHIFK